MQYNLKAPDRLQATVTLPASKSISNRVSILSALAPEAAPLINLADSDDGRALQHALRSADETVDIGAAGTAMRFLTAYSWSTPFEGSGPTSPTPSARAIRRSGSSARGCAAAR